MLKLTLVGAQPALAAAQARAEAAAKTALAWAPSPHGAALVAPLPGGAVAAAVRAALDPEPVDFALSDQAGPARLLLADMDSTIIAVECLDELADFAGKKAEVAAITERAMAGELDFAQALTARVAMLAGLPVAALTQCYVERVRLNPGAAAMVAGLRAAGVRCVLVSGGFTFFTERVAKAAGFDAHRGNVLLEADGRLTGAVAQPILGREAKLAALREEAAALGVGLQDTIAIGDGANDLAMIEAAGLGIAYRAKPIVAAKADARIVSGDLTSVLVFQGLPAPVAGDHPRP